MIFFIFGQHVQRTDMKAEFHIPLAGVQLIQQYLAYVTQEPVMSAVCTVMTCLVDQRDVEE